MAASDVEAASTVAFVLLLTAVFPDVMLADNEVLALRTLVFVVEMFVLAVANELPRLVDARSVCALIAVCADVIFAAVLAVPAVILADSEVLALRTLVFVVEMFVLAVARVEPRLVEARSVCALTAVVTALVCVLVFELIAV